MPFSPLCFESEAIMSRNFSFRLPGLEGSYEKIFIRPVSARSRSRFFHMNTWIFFTNGRAARRDLGNRAIPVDRSYMNRPLKVFFM